MITTERLSTWRAVAAEAEALGLTALAGDLRRAAEELATPVLVAELPKPNYPLSGGNRKLLESVAGELVGAQSLALRAALNVLDGYPEDYCRESQAAEPKPLPCPRCGAAYIAHGALWLHPTADCLDAMRTYWPGQLPALNRRVANETHKAAEEDRAVQSNLAYQYRQRAEALEARCAQLRAELEAALGVTEDRDAWRLICQQAAAALRRWYNGPYTSAARLPHFADILADLEARP